MTTATVANRPPTPARMWGIRAAVAGLAAASAVVYLLIGLEVLAVVEVGPGDPSLLWFGIPASLAFLFGAIVVLVTERRLWWALGAAFQVFAILAYINVAPDRTPPFEFWGIALRVAQVLMVAGLVVLLIRHPKRARQVDGTARTGATAPTTSTPMTPRRP